MGCDGKYLVEVFACLFKWCGISLLLSISFCCINIDIYPPCIFPSLVLSYYQVDLFFYREPEESKEQQEEEAPVQDYPDYGALASGALGGDNWGGIVDAQWPGEAVAPVIPGAVATGWTPEAGGYFSFFFSAFELLNIINWESV